MNKPTRPPTPAEVRAEAERLAEQRDTLVDGMTQDDLARLLSTEEGRAAYERHSEHESRLVDQLGEFAAWNVDLLTTVVGPPPDGDWRSPPWRDLLVVARIRADHRNTPVEELARRSARDAVGDVLHVMPFNWRNRRGDALAMAVDLVPVEAWRLSRERWDGLVDPAVVRRAREPEVIAAAVALLQSVRDGTVEHDYVVRWGTAS